MIVFLALSAGLTLAMLLSARLIMQRLRDRSTMALIALSTVFFLLLFQAGRLTLGV